MSLVRFALAALAVAVPTAVPRADGRSPGSLLVYPLQESGQSAFTILSVTNTNPLPASVILPGGTTNAMFEYVNAVQPVTAAQSTQCLVFDRVETLTPADTLSVLTLCHNLPGLREGYAVVTAQDPFQFKTPWSWNHLVGSMLVITPLGGIASINAIPFESPLPAQAETDVDGDGLRDFDGVEYEGIADELMLEFVAGLESSLVLVNLTGGTGFDVAVGIDLWNDNEFALSTTYSFRCWSRQRLEDVSGVFGPSFLRNNTPDDPGEFDSDCDSSGEFETGWAVLRGLAAFSPHQTLLDPALLGMHVATATFPGFAQGRLLWESPEKQFNGAFLSFGQHGL